MAEVCLRRKIKKENVRRMASEVFDSELDAINTTNINRASEGRTLRKDFGGKPISEDKLEKPSEYTLLHSGGEGG